MGAAAVVEEESATGEDSRGAVRLFSDRGGGDGATKAEVRSCALQVFISRSLQTLLPEARIEWKLSCIEESLSDRVAHVSVEVGRRSDSNLRGIMSSCCCPGVIRKVDADR